MTPASSGRVAPRLFRLTRRQANYPAWRRFHEAWTEANIATLAVLVSVPIARQDIERIDPALRDRALAEAYRAIFTTTDA